MNVSSLQIFYSLLASTFECSEIHVGQHHNILQLGQPTHEFGTCRLVFNKSHYQHNFLENSNSVLTDKYARQPPPMKPKCENGVAEIRGNLDFTHNNTCLIVKTAIVLVIPKIQTYTYVVKRIWR